LIQVSRIVPRDADRSIARDISLKILLDRIESIFGFSDLDPSLAPCSPKSSISRYNRKVASALKYLSSRGSLAEIAAPILARSLVEAHGESVADSRGV